MFKNFVVLGFLSYWLLSLFMVHKWWDGRGTTYSLHAASDKVARLIFAVAISLEITFYLLFAFGWFVPHFNMPFVFGLLITLVAGLHLTAGIIPETKGLSRWIHRKASYVSVVLFLPVFLIIATTHSIPMIARVVAGAYLIIELCLWIIFVTQPARRKEDIVSQSFFISSLPIVLILATYLR